MEQYPNRGLAGSSTGTSKANSIPPNPSSRHVTSQPQLPGPSRVVGDSTSATRESVGQGLAQELPSVESLALPLRVHYNTLLPIFRLPQELLSKIFHICASDNRHHSNPPRTGDLGWIKLTHVCSSWRRVACADRMLWTRISGGLSESWVNAMLDRAKSAPLSIENPNIQGQFLYSMLETHLHHTKLLSLSLSAEDMLDAVNAISSTAPILETLILHVSPPTQYLPTISLKNTSALRTLVLDGVTLDWEVAIPHLETLHIMPASFRKVDSKSLPSTYDLSTLISASASSLRHLKLHGCLPDLSAPDAPFPPISLPSLATLSLAGTKRQCGTIINMLSIPPICNLEIECTVRETPYTDFTPVVSSISGFLKHGESIGPLVDLSIEMAEGHIAIIEGSRGPQCLGFLLSIDFLGAPSEDIHSVFRNLPLHDVDFLSVSPEDGEDPGWDWRELARICPRVTKLRVAARATWPEWWMEIFGVLASPLLDADGPRGGIDDCINHTPALPFPFLRRLELTSISDSSDSSDDEDGASYDDYIAGLRRMLQTRRDQGFVIAELAVSKSFQDLDLDVDGLRGLVSMVEVDMKLDDD